MSSNDCWRGCMSLGPWQVFLVLLIIMVLFGAGKLPQVMGDLGRGLKNLKRELKDGKLMSTEDEPHH
ncbi:twin-arginine translocase TatA/TatE family subunit [Anaplasma platys]|uniref:Sec-independent protein translocase protein TatA n=2 Tax=Anaplasma platys TaxID=949 RepID=A0A858PYR0_9RICK|nr:twin-arginine translocase TatA/TatE family subunit [Anaplasma platys]